MKFRFVLFFFVLVLFWQNNVVAQEEFAPARVFMLNGDTLQGYVQLSDGRSTMQKCVFKATNDGDTRVFTPDDTEAFMFSDGRYYVSRLLPSGTGIQKKRFMEFLVKGIASVYYYYDVVEHYYVEKEQGVLVELISDEKIFHEKHKSYTRPGRYKGLLHVMMNDSPETGKEIDRLKLSHRSLIGLAKDYHNSVCDTGNCIVYESKVPKAKFHIGPAFAISAVNLKIGNYLKSDYSEAYQIGLNMMLTDFLHNSRRFKLKSGIYTAFNFAPQHFTPIDKDSYYIIYEGVRYDFSGYHPAGDSIFPKLELVDLKIPFQIAYDFVKTKNTSFVFGVGFTTKILLHSNPDYHDLFFERYYLRSIRRFKAGSILSLGVEGRWFGNNILSIQSSFEYLLSPNSRQGHNNQNSKQWSLQLGWYF
ncbi:MAG TPA: hypothetical protein PK855_10890 [Bacteroidales bacterium]|nr:hypothetical protein [Bacteroidales bacterium]